MNKNIEELRKKINDIDTELIKLLAERRKVSKEVVIAKKESGKPIRDQQREMELLNKIISIGKEYNLDSHFLTKIFYEIIDDSVRLQQKYLQNYKPENDAGILRIAIQGIEGSYSYLASTQFFAHNEEELIFLYKETFDEVVEAVEKGEADFAVLPIENTTSGGINEVYDLLLHTTLSIVGEEKFQVKHCLIGTQDATISKLTKIFTHYQGASQCSKFLASLPNCEISFYSDTAMSAKKIVEENNPQYGAIASEEAANLFNVKILKRNIANQSENFTRFLVCARKPKEVDLRIPAKTSLVMATSHTPGSLAKAISVFHKYNVNMTKLESRPILGNPWEEMFYLDFEGNTADPEIRQLLDELGKYTRFLKILGTYPSKDIVKTKIDSFADASREPEIEKEEKPVEKELPKKQKVKKSYKLASRDYKPEDTIIKIGDIEIGGDNFIVIAGPCSVESHDQIFACANEAKEHGAHILRGGCFKPRTSPYSFQGLGFEGLNELEAAGKTFGLPVITEVLSPDQVEAVARQADILQIGARNMQNFSLLKAVGRCHRPVMLKRGMMSSLDELLNAAEYILSQGNRQVILCERGIRTFETATRNTLDLSAIPVLKELTHLPIIVDPSHAIGQRDKVVPLAKAAKVVGAHGIMVEFHPEPEKALSDPDQALRFDQFEEMMRDLRKL